MHELNYSKNSKRPSLLPLLQERFQTFFWVFLLSALFLFLPSCSSKQTANTESIDTVLKALDEVEEKQLSRLPNVAVGDIYVFDNPQESWEVVDIQNQYVFWISDGGVRTVTSRNPIMPILEWESAEYGQGKRLITEIEGNLFPMKRGRKISFRSTVTIDEEKAQWSFYWRCLVTGKKKIALSSGEFETFRVICKRDNKDRIAYYFAPRLGYFVRMETGGTKGVPLRRRDLVGYDNNASSSKGFRQGAGKASTLSSSVLPLPAPSNLANKRAVRSPDGVAGTRRGNLAGALTNSRGQEPGISASERALSNRGSPTIGENADGEPQARISDLGATPPLSGRGAEAQSLQESAIKERNDLVDKLSPSGGIGRSNRLQSGRQPTISDLLGRDATTSTAASVGVHLSSHSSLEAARDAWQKARGRFADVIGERDPVIRRVDLGLRGVVFRLFVAPFSSLSEAVKLCEELKARQSFCRVVEF